MTTFITDYLESFFDELDPMDFYRRLFPLGELEQPGHQEPGKYNAIAVELLPKVGKDKANVRRYLIHDDLKGLKELQDSDNFVIISPISYAGMRRTSHNARYIYAIAFDLDGVTDQQNIIDLFHQIDIEYLPRPTYIVASGTGLHLYYQLEQPLPCFKNIVKQLQELKKDLTKKLWNGYVTSLENHVQYESLFQGFRMVGGVTKSGGERTRVFEIGKKVSIEYLNDFVLDDIHKVTQYAYKSQLPLAQAREKYPDWYEKRVVQKQPRGTWTTKQDLFHWWVKKLKQGATVGHRYYCIMVLAVYAKKAGIEQEELERVAFDLVEHMEMLTNREDNHFTRADVLAALEMYNDNYITFPIDSIVKLTDIPIVKNKRNYRKQAEHIKLMNFVRDELNDNKDWRNKNGRPTKEKQVKEWQQQHPGQTKAACIRDTGLSKPTVYKYWSTNEE